MEGAEIVERSAKEKFWQGHIAGWKASGHSQQVYCRNNNLAVATFGYWRRKLQVEKSDKPRFYPLAVTAPSKTVHLSKGENAIRLVLDGNRFSIEIGDNFSPSTLQRLILALEHI
jgi:hypothetical protein